VLVLVLLVPTVEFWKGYAAGRREELLFLFSPRQETVLSSSPLAHFHVLVVSI
jgi:hypothetical protein